MSAQGADPLGAGKSCVGYLTLPLAGGAIAHVHVNWLSPTKIRQMVIGGSQRTLVWDDLNPQQRLSVYDRGVDLVQQSATAPTARAATVSYRLGDTGRRPCPSARRSAPMVAEFAAAIRERRGPPAPTAPPGCACCRVLEAAGTSLRARRRAASTSPPRPTSPALELGPMTALRGSHACWSPAAPAPSARPSSTSCSTPAWRTSTCSTTWCAGAAANLDDALASGRVELVEGDMRDRDLVHDLTRGKDLVFHQAAIRITQCAEEPRLALEVLVDGTFNVLEAAVEHEVDKVVAASSASVYGLAEEFPTTERHHHHNNDTFYGAAKSFNEGMLRSFRAMYGLDYVALRYFNVYGPRMDVHGLYTEVLVRWMERIADGRPPLIFGDGRQTMDFVYTRDIARANVLAAASDVVEGVYNVASGDRDQPARAGRGAAAR